MSPNQFNTVSLITKISYQLKVTNKIFFQTMLNMSTGAGIWYHWLGLNANFIHTSRYEQEKNNIKIHFTLAILGLTL